MNKDDILAKSRAENAAAHHGAPTKKRYRKNSVSRVQRDAQKISDFFRLFAFIRRGVIFSKLSSLYEWFSVWSPGNKPSPRPQKTLDK